VQFSSSYLRKTQNGGLSKVTVSSVFFHLFERSSVSAEPRSQLKAEQERSKRARLHPWRVRKAFQGRSRSIPQFVIGDAIAYIRSLPDYSVDSVLTERFLQNLPSRESHGIIREAKRVLRRSGRLHMCEGSQDVFDALNELRESVGLARIPAGAPKAFQRGGSTTRRLSAPSRKPSSGA